MDVREPDGTLRGWIEKPVIQSARPGSALLLHGRRKTIHLHVECNVEEGWTALVVRDPEAWPIIEQLEGYVQI